MKTRSLLSEGLGPEGSPWRCLFLFLGSSWGKGLGLEL